MALPQVISDSIVTSVSAFSCWRPSAVRAHAPRQEELSSRFAFKRSYYNLNNKGVPRLLQGLQILLTIQQFHTIHLFLPASWTQLRIKYLLEFLENSLAKNLYGFLWVLRQPGIESVFRSKSRLTDSLGIWSCCRK